MHPNVHMLSQFGMVAIFVVIFILAFLEEVVCQIDENIGRGQRQHEFLVALAYPNDFFCGAGLVTPVTAITACSCVAYVDRDPVKPKDTRGLAGWVLVHDSKNRLEAFKNPITLIWLNPGCAQGETYVVRDTAIVRFEKIFTGSQATPVPLGNITLWNQIRLLKEQECKVAVWQPSMMSRAGYSPVLEHHVIPVTLLDDKTCGSRIACPSKDRCACTENLILSNMSCASAARTSAPLTPDVCQSAHGSPVVCRYQAEWRLYGVFSEDNCSPGSSDILYASPRAFMRDYYSAWYMEVDKSPVTARKNLAAQVSFPFYFIIFYIVILTLNINLEI